MSKDLVSFVVLNWNGLSDTLVCLDSIRKQTYSNTEIIVVDNGSSIEQKEHLRSLNDIIFIDLPKNTGFTGGQLAAFEHAKGSYIALVNNDSVLANDWCEQALKALRTQKAAAVGGRAYSWNEENGEKPFSETNPFYSYQIVNPTSGHTTTVRSGNSEVSVNSISGSAVMLDCNVINKVGYFDNRFFAYYEETDLFARMKRAGFNVYYSPLLKTWHKIAQSTRSNPRFYLYFMHRNRFIFGAKNYDPRYFRKFIFSYAREWLKACCIILTKFGRSDIESRMLVKAGLWNLLHLAPTMLSRHRTQKLGKTYNSLLQYDAGNDVTIVIPCYNYANFVTEAIESAVGQTYSPSEIIIIDDGSTDNSLEVINKRALSLAKGHPKISIRTYSQENSGVITTKNRGIELSQGQFTIFLDADDILDKYYIEKCLKLMLEKKADIVYTDMKMFGAVDYVQSVLPFNRYRLRSVNFIHNSALYKTALLRRVGGYSPEMSIGYEDWELNLKVSKITHRFQYLSEPLLLYRRHDGASRDNNAQQKLPMVVKLLEKLHPELYNLRFYWWLETNRLKESLKVLIAYPFRLAKHTYFHLLMGLDRKSRDYYFVGKLMKILRSIKHRNV